MPPRVLKKQGFTTEILSRGQRGWREYRQAGGIQRYARDRWWVKADDGQWKKKARNRKDIPSMTEADYEQWKERRKAARAQARATRKQEGEQRNTPTSANMRQVAVG